ncbi:MAG: AI-2E family transporter [Janthinobacterium lividum]
MPMNSKTGHVPVRTILATIGLVLVTALALLLLYKVQHVLVWIVVALFFTVALYPVTAWTERKITRGHRTPATILVFLVLVLVLAGLITAFAVPLATEGTQFATQLPQLITDARSGRGTVGRLLERTHALAWVQSHQAQIAGYASGLTGSASGVLSGVATGIAGVVTVFVLSILMVLEGPKVVSGLLNIVDDDHSRERIRSVAADCAKSITGYISGNLLISIICGVLTYITLKIMGVPFAGLIALFVGLADLIPLVGATIGAIAALIAAAVHSIPALIVVAIFVVLYQQLENHVLQPVILSRTVKLNPLAVLVAILVGVELAGILGALLAIPVAGIVQVIIRDLWNHRSGRPKIVPTVGEEQRPA